MTWNVGLPLIADRSYHKIADNTLNFTLVKLRHFLAITISFISLIHILMICIYIPGVSDASFLLTVKLLDFG